MTLYLPNLSIIDKTLRLRNISKSGLSVVISIMVFVSAIIFGSIVIYNISLFSGIPVHWKIAIASFIFFLPISFFLQAKLHENSSKQIIRNNIIIGLNKASNNYIPKNNTVSLSNQTLDSKTKKDYDELKVLLDKNRDLYYDLQLYQSGIKDMESNLDIKRLEEEKYREEIRHKLDDTNRSVYDHYENCMRLQTDLKVLVNDYEILDLDSGFDREFEFNNRTIVKKISEISGIITFLLKTSTSMEKILIKKLDRFDPSEWTFKNIKDILKFLQRGGDDTIYRIYKNAFSIIEKKISFAIENDYRSYSKRDLFFNMVFTNPLATSPEQNEKLLKQLKDMEDFNIDANMDEIIDLELDYLGINLRSYILPLSFFLFIYFTGFLITLPLVNTVFTGEVQTTTIPLFENPGSNYNGIPLIVIQWGFLGGFVYTSISLLFRFLRRDIVPRVYFNSAFRLLLAAVASIIIYFFYTLALGNNEPPLTNTHPQLLLMCFVAGIAPIQFLIKVADYQLSKLPIGWKRNQTAGNHSITQIEGVNYMTAERLSEENIDYIQQLAICSPHQLALKTNYDEATIADWKDQAILYLLTSDIVILGKDYKNNKPKLVSLHYALNKRMGIKRFTQLNKRIKKLFDDDTKSDEKIHFINGLGFSNEAFDQLDNAFKSILVTGRDYQIMQNYILNMGILEKGETDYL